MISNVLQVEVPAGQHVVLWHERMVVGNTLWGWAAAIVICLLVILGLLLAKVVVGARLARIAKRTSTRTDDLIVSLLADLRMWCVVIVAVYAGASTLVLPVSAGRAIKLAFIGAVALQLLITSRLIVDYTIQTALARRRGNDGQPDRALASASGIIRFLAMLVLGSLLVLLALSNMGVQITPLLTGLGIGGIAIALAAQSILGDLFASLTIVFDKPFQLGDFIIVGDKMGTVENIGVKTSRVRALTGEQLVFGNTDLLGSRIQNFKTLQERRVVSTLSVVYETPRDKLSRIAGIVRDCVLAQGTDRVRLDRSHLKSLGSYSIDFEYVYYVLTGDYNTHMDIQQAIILEIVRRFEQEGIDFAYPTSVEIRRTEGSADNERASSLQEAESPRPHGETTADRRP